MTSSEREHPIRHEFLEAGEIRFHLASCGAGERLALCLHGFPESSYSWRHQMPLLAELGYRDAAAKEEELVHFFSDASSGAFSETRAQA